MSVKVSIDHFQVTREKKFLWWSPWEDSNFVDQLRAGGIEFVPTSQADLTLVHPIDFEKGPKRPLVVMDHYDRVSTLDVQYRRFLNTKRIQAVIKNSHYNPSSLENAPHFEGTLFGVEALELASLGERPCAKSEEIKPELTGEALAKIHSINNIIWATHSDYFDVPVDEQSGVLNMSCWRPIDIMFLGSVSHYNLWTPRWHRVKAMDALRRLPRDVVTLTGGTFDKVKRAHKTRFGSQPNRHIHYQLMRQSKIALSPFGFSELSKRDYEAISAGCVLLKPSIDHVRVWPEMPYVKCCLDYSNLTEVVEGILNEWEGKWRLEAVKNARRYRSYRSDRNMLVKKYVEIFEGVRT